MQVPAGELKIGDRIVVSEEVWIAQNPGNGSIVLVKNDEEEISLGPNEVVHKIISK